MTEEAQLIALLECMGWRRLAPNTHPHWWTEPNGNASGRDGAPPLTLDLMREARKHLPPSERRDYVKHRWAIARHTSEHMVTDNDMFKFADISPEHDVEAFLRAKGLWVEETPLGTSLQN